MRDISYLAVQFLWYVLKYFFYWCPNNITDLCGQTRILKYRLRVPKVS